jgi:hypothetical protein
LSAGPPTPRPDEVLVGAVVVEEIELDELDALEFEIDAGRR